MTRYTVGQQIEVRTDEVVTPMGDILTRTPMATIVDIGTEETFLFGKRTYLTLRADDDLLEIFGTKKGDTFIEFIR